MNLTPLQIYNIDYEEKIIKEKAFEYSIECTVPRKERNPQRA